MEKIKDMYHEQNSLSNSNNRNSNSEDRLLICLGHKLFSKVREE